MNSKKDFDFVLNDSVMIITIILITLKASGLISWGWIWILSPIWLPPVIIIGLFLIAFILNLFSKKTWNKLK